MGNKLFYRIRLPALLLVLAGTYSGLTTTHAQTIRPGTQKELKIFDPTSNASGNIGLRAAAGTSSYTLTLPSSLPTANQVLGVNGISGNVATLTWTTVSVTAVSTFSGGTTGLTPSTATSGAVTLAGTLGVANGGTGVTSSTGSGSVVLNNSPALVTPALGTPSSAILTNATGLPISTGLSGLGTGVATMLSTPTSANIIAAVTDETGSGALVFGTAPSVSSLTVASGGANITGNLVANSSGATAGEIRIVEPNGSEYTALRAQTQTSTITYTLPAADGSGGQVLSTNGSGTLSWITTSASVPISSLIAATGINTINNASFGQTWQWNTLAGSSALTLSTNSTAATSNAQTLLTVSMSGNNGTSTQTTYGATISNSHTGTASTNVGLQVNASGGTNNYGLLVSSGSVGVGVNTPANAVHIDAGNATASNLQFSAGTTTGQLNSDGFTVGITTTGAATINQRENLALTVATNNTTRLTIAADGAATFTGNVTGLAFFESSDQRLKNVIKRDGDVAYFKWKDGRDSTLHIGYIAQEVQGQLPDQVKKDEQGYLSVNYTEVLVNKIRSLEKRIAELEKSLKIKDNQ